MPAIVILFRLRIAFAFGRKRMNDDRTIVDLFSFIQGRNEGSRIVTVDVADVFETQAR